MNGVSISGTTCNGSPLHLVGSFIPFKLLAKCQFTVTQFSHRELLGGTNIHCHTKGSIVHKVYPLIHTKETTKNNFFNAGMKTEEKIRNAGNVARDDEMISACMQKE